MSKVKPAPLPPDTVIGGYRVVRKLSAGGFGVVYLAVDKHGQQVAVKEYLPASLASREAVAFLEWVRIREPRQPTGTARGRGATPKGAAAMQGGAHSSTCQLRNGLPPPPCTRRGSRRSCAR